MVFVASLALVHGLVFDVLFQFFEFFDFLTIKGREFGEQGLSLCLDGDLGVLEIPEFGLVDCRLPFYL